MEYAVGKPTASSILPGLFLALLGDWGPTCVATSEGRAGDKAAKHDQELLPNQLDHFGSRAFGESCYRCLSRGVCTQNLLMRPRTWGLECIRNTEQELCRRESWDIGGAPPPIKSPRSKDAIAPFNPVHGFACGGSPESLQTGCAPMNGPPRRRAISDVLPSCIAIVLATCKGRGISSTSTVACPVGSRWRHLRTPARQHQALLGPDRVALPKRSATALTMGGDLRPAKGQVQPWPVADHHRQSPCSTAVASQDFPKPRPPITPQKSGEDRQRLRPGGCVEAGSRLRPSAFGNLQKSGSNYRADLQARRHPC